MNFDAQVMNMVNQNLFALDQAQANIFPAHLDPYAGAGFVQNQIDFNQAFLANGWNQAQALAAIWPNDQPIPGFTTADLVATNMEGQAAFDSLLGTMQAGSDAVFIANGNVTNALIGGTWNGTAIDGTSVSGISNNVGFAGVDPFGNVIGSDVPIQDPWFSPVVGWSEPTGFWI
ncbi:MAG: hypothetical protein ACFCAD_00110 [Pleurocapsa sp.]